MTKHLCSVSIDLDNLWSYLKVHGDKGWSDYPSYLSIFVPRLLEFLNRRAIRISVFIVGKDAAIETNHRWLRQIADAGHEICNHSFHHEPWLHLYTPEQIEEELTQAEEAILEATGQRARGFRGPGYSLSPEVLRSLRARGYSFDASTFPTFIGPLARAYYFYTSDLSAEEKRMRGSLFGSWREALRPNKPYFWDLAEGELLEIPVTTMPLLRAPFHFSYLIFLAERLPAMSRLYLRIARKLCQLTGTEPSMLLHPLDFLGPEDAPDLAFFPGMKTDATTKLGWMHGFFDLLEERFALVTMGDHAEWIIAHGGTRLLNTEGRFDVTPVSPTASRRVMPASDGGS